MKILAIDPGTNRSAFVLYDSTTEKLLRFGIEENAKLLSLIKHQDLEADQLVIEMIKSYGMPIGDSTLETCVWIGRFLQVWPWSEYTTSRLPRKTIATELCGKARANDANVRAALVERFGGKAKAIGTKAAPGKLYGVVKDTWQALAVAVAWLDLNKQNVNLILA